MSMLDRLPTVEEMMAALSSPISPQTQSTQQEVELSTDAMIKMIFEKVMQPPAAS